MQPPGVGQHLHRGQALFQAEPGDLAAGQGAGRYRQYRGCPGMVSRSARTRSRSSASAIFGDGGQGQVGMGAGLPEITGDGVGPGCRLVSERQVPDPDAVLLADLQDPAGVVQRGLAPADASTCPTASTVTGRQTGRRSRHGRSSVAAYSSGGSTTKLTTSGLTRTAGTPGISPMPSPATTRSEGAARRRRWTARQLRWQQRTDGTGSAAPGSADPACGRPCPGGQPATLADNGRGARPAAAEPPMPVRVGPWPTGRVC